MVKTKPEVLVPAGDRERLEAALRFGADAVYLGGKLFNMRAGTKSFTQEELAERIDRSPAFVGHVEAPNIKKAVSLDTLFAIAQALDVPAYRFLIFDDSGL